MEWQKWVLGEIARLVASLRLGLVSTIRVWDAKGRGYRLAGAHGQGVQHLAPMAPARGSLTGTVARSGLPSLATVAFIDPADRLEFGTSSEVALYYGVPIKAGDHVLGVLNAMFAVGAPPTDDEREVMTILAGHAGAAMAASAMFAKLDDAVLHADDAERRQIAAEVFIETFRTLFRARAALLVRIRPDGELVIQTMAGDVSGPYRKALAMPPGSGIAGLAARAKSPMSSADVWADSRLVFPAFLHSHIAQAPDRAILSAPLIVDDEVIGVASARDLTGRRFVRQELQLAAAAASRAAPAVRG